jgi:hypothetical protein
MKTRQELEIQDFVASLIENQIVSIERIQIKVADRFEFKRLSGCEEAVGAALTALRANRYDSEGGSTFYSNRTLIQAS